MTTELWSHLGQQGLQQYTSSVPKYSHQGYPDYTSCNITIDLQPCHSCVLFLFSCYDSHTSLQFFDSIEIQISCIEICHAEGFLTATVSIAQHAGSSRKCRTAMTHTHLRSPGVHEKELSWSLMSQVTAALLCCCLPDIRAAASS